MASYLESPYRFLWSIRDTCMEPLQDIWLQISLQLSAPRPVFWRKRLPVSGGAYLSPQGLFCWQFLVYTLLRKRPEYVTENLKRREWGPAGPHFYLTKLFNRNKMLRSSGCSKKGEKFEYRIFQKNRKEITFTKELIFENILSWFLQFLPRIEINEQFFLIFQFWQSLSYEKYRPKL